MGRYAKEANNWSIEYTDEDSKLRVYGFSGTQVQLFEELRKLTENGYLPVAYNLSLQAEVDVKSTNVKRNRVEKILNRRSRRR
jgi:hypothetical protein